MWLSYFIDKFIEEKGIAKEFELVKLWKNWDRVVGTSIANMARPLGKRGNTLLIGVEDSVVMQELSFYSEEFLKKIEKFLGWQPFDKVKYKLLEDKTPLTELDPLVTERSLIAGGGQEVLPTEIGKLSLPESSSVGRAYNAYLRLVKRK